MITEKISEYSKRSEFRYCNYCKYFITDPNISFRRTEENIGEGYCSLCRLVLEYYRTGCNSFKFNFKPKYQTVSEQEIVDAQHNKCFTLEKRKVRLSIQYKQLAASWQFFR